MFLGGRYRLLSAPLSTGSFGSVFVAEDQRMPRRVAVKILHPQHAENPTVRARFKRELEAACRVSHENVVSVYDIGEDPNLGLYYVMELVRGTPLKDYLSGAPLPWPFVYRVGLQMARALQAIHAAGIIHRDLKPQNIMLVERSSLGELVKVLDFGIASLKSQGEEQGDVELTGARMVLGTPPYMSPEQTYMKSDRDRLGLDVDARSDLYSLGVILYELAAGRRPFSGDAHDIVVAHRLTKPMPLDRMVGVSVPAPFADLVMRCLQKDPDDRPESAKALTTELKRCHGLPVRQWHTGEVDAIDPRDQPTQMDLDALPITTLPEPPKPRATAPRLSVSAPTTPSRLLWAPLAALGATAVAVTLLMMPPSRADDGVDRVATDAAPTAHQADLGSTERTARAAVDPPPAGAAVAVAPSVDAAALPTEAAPPTRDAAAAPETAPPPVDVAAAKAPTVAPTVNIMVTTAPPGAKVSVGGEPRGETPVNISIDAAAAKKIELLLKKKQYRDHTVSLAIGPELAGKVIVVNEALKKAKRGTPAARPPEHKDPFESL